MQKSRLTNLELYEMAGSYYLRAEYEVEDEYKVQKHTLPRLYLPIGDHFIINQHPHWHGYDIKVDFGELQLDVLEQDGYTYKVETIKEYPKKMTLEEIEKKLGYKVEIVSGK